MSTKKQKSYTWQEISKHNTEESCWVYRDDKVYDVTSFISKHPGGKDMMLLMAGRDISDFFDCYHPFTDKPDKILQSFQIGILSGPSEFTAFKKDSGFYKDCCNEVGKYFKENNIDYKSPVYGTLHLLLIISMILSPWYFSWTNYFGLSIIGRLCLMIISGIFQGMLLIHTMHDCSHTAFTHSPFIWKYFGRMCLDLICGCSFDAWLHQHVVGHHVYTNINGIDPDVPLDKHSDIRRIMPSQKWTNRYKLQYIWLPLLYCVYAFKNRIQDLTQTLFGKHNGAMRVNPEYYNTESFIRQMLCKSMWVIRAIFIPIFLWGNDLWTFIPLFLTMELTTGYFLTFNFQVSHVSPVVNWPEPIKNKKTGKISVDYEWAKLQIETSVDYGHNSYLARFWSGALNYQSVHHLFPSVSQYHYPQIAPIIIQQCKKHNVKFNHIPTFYEAFYLHLKQLYDMSIEPTKLLKNKLK